MNANNIILQNLTHEELKSLMIEVVREELSQLGQQNQKRYLSRKEVKELLKISYPTLNLYTKKGILQGLRIEGRVLYDAEQVENSLKKIDSIKYKRG